MLRNRYAFLTRAYSVSIQHRRLKNRDEDVRTSFLAERRTAEKRFPAERNTFATPRIYYLPQISTILHFWRPDDVLPVSHTRRRHSRDARARRSLYVFRVRDSLQFIFTRNRRYRSERVDEKEKQDMLEARARSSSRRCPSFAGLRSVGARLTRARATENIFHFRKRTRRIVARLLPVTQISRTPNYPRNYGAREVSFNNCLTLQTDNLIFPTFPRCNYILAYHLNYSIAIISG